MPAAEAVKSTVEKFTTAGNQAFKDAIEKSLSGLGEVNSHSKKNLEAVIASVSAVTKGAETLGAEAMAYSKKSVEDQVSVNGLIACVLQRAGDSDVSALLVVDDGNFQLHGHGLAFLHRRKVLRRIQVDHFQIL